MGATLFAFRQILLEPFRLLSGAEVESWLFVPTRDSIAIAVVLAAWLLWRRRACLSSPRPNVPGRWDWRLAAITLALFSWSLAFDAPHLLIPSLCLHMALAAGAVGGTDGLRAVAMPCAALMLAFPPPNPILSEVVWSLQNVSASGSAALLEALRFPVELEGTELRLDTNVFVVIEGCSGWRGIQILALLSLVAGELRGLPTRRALLLVVLAIPLGIALNIARACLVVLSKSEIPVDAFESHTPQGIAVILLGTILLYGAAAWLETEPTAGAAPLPDEDDPPRSPRSPREIRLAVGFAAMLALLAGAQAVFVPPRAEPHATPIDFPLALGAWTGTRLPVDYHFPYSSSRHPQYRAEYRNLKTGDLVDLMIAREERVPSGLNRQPDSKLLRPSSDWTLIESGPDQSWRLGIEVQRAVLSRNDDKAFVYTNAWRVGDDGLLLETLASLLGWDTCRFGGRDCGRVVLRLAAPMRGTDDTSRRRAEDAIDRFVGSFRARLTRDALAVGSRQGV